MLPANPYMKPPDPVRCCHNCGAEFHDGGHWQAEQFGWSKAFTKPMRMKQINGTYRMEYLGTCPDCHPDGDEKGL